MSWARTIADPPVFYLRSYENSAWGGWAQITLDIKAHQCVPAMYRGRICLFWLDLKVSNEPQQQLPPVQASTGPPSQDVERYVTLGVYFFDLPQRELGAGSDFEGQAVRQAAARFEPGQQYQERRGALHNQGADSFGHAGLWRQPVDRRFSVSATTNASDIASAEADAALADEELAASLQPGGGSDLVLAEYYAAKARLSRGGGHVADGRARRSRGFRRAVQRSRAQ